MHLALTYASAEVQAPIKINTKPDFLVNQWYRSVIKSADEEEMFLDRKTNTLKVPNLPGIAFTLNAQWIQEYFARFGHLDGGPQQLSYVGTEG